MNNVQMFKCSNVQMFKLNYLNNVELFLNIFEPLEQFCLENFRADRKVFFRLLFSAP
jgi:hypothetical protein